MARLVRPGLFLVWWWRVVDSFVISCRNVRRRSLHEATRLTEERYSARVEESLIQKYGLEDINRVLSSWRDLSTGKMHEEVLDSEHPLMRQEARSYVPGLSVQTFWSIDQFEWTRKLADGWHTVRKEFEAVALADGGTSLKNSGNNVWAAAIDNEASAYGRDWRTLVLMDRGRWDPTNAALFPETCRLIDAAGVPAVEAFFAAMKPNTTIKPHSDTCNFVLTSHLGLVIPGQDEAKPPCRLSVGDQTRAWREGQVSLFDTSILHDAINDSDQYRYILMFRVWHPELTPTERKGLQFLFDCLEEPGLVSEHPMDVLDAEARVAAQRAPLDTLLIETTSTKISSTPIKKRRRAGFGATPIRNVPNKKHSKRKK